MWAWGSGGMALIPIRSLGGCTEEAKRPLAVGCLPGVEPRATAPDKALEGKTGYGLEPGPCRWQSSVGGARLCDVRGFLFSVPCGRGWVRPQD